MTRIEKIENQIASLPQGYVTRKVINKKPYFYLQWQSNGKTVSRTLKENEIEVIRAQVEERKKFEKELKI